MDKFIQLTECQQFYPIHPVYTRSSSAMSDLGRVYGLIHGWVSRVYFVEDKCNFLVPVTVAAYVLNKTVSEIY